MNEPSYFIREQDVYLLWLDNRRHLAKAEGRMCHRLPFAICARPIVRRAVFSWRALFFRVFAFFECGVYACPSPKPDSSAFSTTSLVFLPTKNFEIKI